jgi:hypothetical protein
MMARKYFMMAVRWLIPPWEKGTGIPAMKERCPG